VSRLVVKLGGSTSNQAELDLWISALAGASVPLVVVPGGGPFADTVREAQKSVGFSDTAAHAMALLAMEQFGHVILDRHQRFTAARSLTEIADALARKEVPVWFPSAMALSASEIPASWQVTSDSLAAWLAGQLGAGALLLIKQTSAFSVRDDSASLSAKGIVDPALVGMLPPAVELYVAGPKDAAHAAFGPGRLPGTRIAGLPARKTA
jgi:aspartokinase-like uncharacterized kinase